jgi:hypothetical protein
MGRKDLDTGATPLILGFWNYNGSYFKGAIDEVRIYRKALTPEEIFQLAGNEIVSKTNH